MVKERREKFLRDVLRELTGVLEDCVGLDEAEGFIALVGGRLGDLLHEDIVDEEEVERVDARKLAEALVKFKAGIGGAFSIASIDEKKIVLRNTTCPFGRHVLDRTSLCMMTSNVFGRVASKNFGYARVEIEESIARHDAGCLINIYFDQGAGGREYFA